MSSTPTVTAIPTVTATPTAIPTVTATFPYSTSGNTISSTFPYSTSANTVSSTPYSTTPSTTLYNQSQTSTTRYNQSQSRTINNKKISNIRSDSEVDIGNNVDNLNDFMAKNTLIGSNLYISPMNSTGIDDQNKKKNGKYKISSSFFPIVKIS